MTRVTTPVHYFTIKNFPIETIAKLLITYSQNGHIIIEKTEKDVTVSEINGENKFVVELTQEETYKMQPGSVKIQMRFVTESGSAYASPIYSESVRDVLNDTILESRSM